MAVQCLTDSQKEAVVEAFENGLTQSEIAYATKVSRRTIQRVIAESKATTSKAKAKTVEAVAAVVEDADNDANCEIPSTTYSIIGNGTCISITGSTGESRTVDHLSPLFQGVYDVILNKGISQLALKEAFDKMDMRSYVLDKTHGKVTIDPFTNSAIYMKGTNNELYFRRSLSERLCELVETDNTDGELDRLVNFASLIANSPDKEIIDELYDFLLASDIEIDEDGNVICWKKVNENYRDCYTNTFDNSVGSVCEVPRVAVDNNRNVTCSHGLHVCSRAYLRSYGGQKIMKVSVAPQDFIAIPNEYYRIDGEVVTAKARVCRYKVLEDCTEAMNEYI